MNENPEGTPNPLNPAPGTGEEMAAGTGTLDFMETAPAPEPAAEPEIPAEPVAPVEPTMATEPQTPEVTEAPTVPEVQNTIEATEAIPVQEAPATAEPVDIATFATTTTTETIEPAPVSENNFDTLGTSDTPDEVVHVRTEQTLSFPMNKPASAEPAPGPELVAKDSIVEPAGKNGKKKAFIIGAIVFLMVAVICGATAVAIMMMGKTDDRPTKALEKLINGQVPNIIAVQGNINMLSDADNEFMTTIGSANIDLNGKFDTESGMADVTAKFKLDIGEEQITFNVDTIRNEDADDFVKIRGIKDLANSDALSVLIGYPSESSAASVIYGSLFESIDEQWISLTEGSSSTNFLGYYTDSSSMCPVEKIKTLSNYGKEIAEKYNDNQFLTFSTEKLAIVKKQNTLYEVKIDAEKLAAFMNSIASSKFVNELEACLGDATTKIFNTDTETVKKVIDMFPAIYVEIDDSYNFTRLYLKFNTDTGASSMSTTVDFLLSYPAKMDIETPSDYTTFNTIIENLYSNIYSTYYGATE